MAYAHFERLSAMDLSFLAMEDGRAHMHIGSVSIFEAPPLRAENGRIDFDRILAFVEAQLHKVPRLRQRLEWITGFQQPVWIDDDRFNIRFHVRHTALPAPGDERQLKRLAGRILSQEFDRGKPLWEDWIVEGLEGDRVALVSKVHHCMADGLSGVEMGTLLVGPDPDYEPPPARQWIPRPAPGAAQLVLEEARHRLATPFSLLRAMREQSGEERGPVSESDGPSGLGALIGTAREALSAASETPLNIEIGPHRRFDWTRMPFDQVREVGRVAGATVNDVVLATASGALRAFLKRRGVLVDEIDFHAVVPVSVRREAERSALGNRVSGLLVRLPLDEAHAWKRLLRVVDLTHDLKASGLSGAGDRMGQALDLLPTQLLGPLFRMASRTSAANLVITNVPGPRVPVYMLGARQLASYPVVPLAATQGLGIALLSYADGLHWGFNADWDALPDLHDFVLDVEKSFGELVDEAPVSTPEAPTTDQAPSREVSA